MRTLSLLVLLSTLGLAACSSGAPATESGAITVDDPARLLVVLDLANTVETEAEAFAGAVQAELDARGAQAQVVRMRTGYGDGRLEAAIAAFRPDYTALVTASDATRIASVPGLNTSRRNPSRSTDAVPAELVILDRDGIAYRENRIALALQGVQNGARLLLRDLRRLGVPTEAGS